MAKKQKQAGSRDTGKAMPPPAAGKATEQGRWVGLVVFGLALAVRLVSLAEISPSPLAELPAPDAEYYLRAGAELRHHGLFSGGVFAINPLYTVIVGWLVPLIGISGICFLQAVLGSLSAWFIHRIGAEVFGKRAGLLAGIAFALYPMSILFSLALLPVTIAVAGCGGAVLLALKTGARGRAAPALAVGLLLGFTALARPNLLLWAGAFMIWYWLVAPPARRWRSVALILLGLILPLTATTARNLAVSGEPVLISSNGGINFYYGNHPGATGAFTIPPGFPNTPLEQLSTARSLAETACGEELGPSAVSRYWFSRGWEFLADHPGSGILLWLRKAALLFNARELPINEGLVEYGAFSRLLSLPLPWYGLIVPLGITGLFFLALGKGDQPGRWLLLLIICAHLAGVVPFFVSSRHRLPVLIALLPLAGMALDELLRLWREADRRRLLQSVAVLIVAAAFCWLPLTPSVKHYAYNRLGCIYLEVEDFNQAEETFRKAVSLAPDYPDAHYNLGVALKRLSRNDEARREYQTALSLQPGHREALLNISSELYRSGRYPEAEERYQALIRFHPDYAQAHYNLALIRLRTGRPGDALAGFEEALRLDPRYARAYLQAGLILKGNPQQADRAVAYLRAYLQLEPGGQFAVMARAELEALTSKPGR